MKEAQVITKYKIKNAAPYKDRHLHTTAVANNPHNRGGKCCHRCHFCHNCLPLSQLFPARALSDWCNTIMLQLNVTERLPPSHTASKDNMSLLCLWNVLWRNCSEETAYTGQEMATLTTSIFGSCNDSSFSHHQHQEILDWCTRCFKSNQIKNNLFSSSPMIKIHAHNIYILLLVVWLKFFIYNVFQLPNRAFG